MKQPSRKTFCIATISAALVVGLIYAYPDIRFLTTTGQAYKGIAPIGFRDEMVYLARLNAIYKGDRSLCNPAIYEHKDDPVIMPPLSETIEAGAGRLFRLDIASLDMLATFLLPFVLFILIAVFSYDLSRSLYGAIGSALAVLLGMHFFSRIFLLNGKILNTAYKLPLWFARPITPQMHFIFFLSALIFIYKSMDGGFKHRLLAGIFLGLLFYVSVFYWAYLYAVMAVLFVIYAAFRDRDSIKNIVSVMAVSLLVSVPYWLENIKTVSHPNYPMLLYRFNIAYTHKPVFPPGAVLLLVLIIIWRRRLIASIGVRAVYFLASMMAAVCLTLNQQVLTGKLFKESHWLTYTGKFVIIVTGILLMAAFLNPLFEKRNSRPWIRGSLAVIFIGLNCIHAVGMQTNYFNKNYGDNLALQRLAPVFNWLKTNVSKDNVILPSPNDIRLSELLPIYTKSFVYYSEPFFCLSLISFDETRYRMLASYRLFDFTLEEAISHPYSWDGAIFLTNDSNRTKAFMEEERDGLVSEYREIETRDGLESAKRYRVDYVLAVNGRDDGVVKKLVDSGSKKVYEDGAFSVVKV